MFELTNKIQGRQNPMKVQRKIFFSVLLAILLLNYEGLSTNLRQLNFTFYQVSSRIFDLETRGEDTKDLSRSLNECEKLIQSKKYSDAENSLKVLVKTVNERYQKSYPQVYTYGDVVFEDVFADISLGNKVGFIASPKAPGKYPGIIFLRGASGSAINLKKILSRYAQKNFICLAPEFNDNDFLKGVVDLNKWYEIFKLHASVDSEHTGVVSYSRGGYFAYKMIEENKPLRAWVNFYGVVYPNMVNIEAIRRNPVPVLILHGQKDKICPVKWAANLENAYRMAGAPYQIKIFKEEGHGFNPEAMEEARAQMDNFIDEYLIKK
jgi:dienelactone hydrolase